MKSVVVCICVAKGGATHMTTLEDLYYGNISPHERYIKRGTRVDKLGRLIAVSYNGVKTYEYIYNNNGDLYCTKDLANGISYISEYDTLGRLIRMRETDAEGDILSVENTFDQYGRASKTTYIYGGLPRSYRLSYKEFSDILESVNMPNGAKVEYMHDHLERITGIIVKNSTGNSVYAGSTYEYSSGNGANTTSDTIDKVTLNVTNSQYSYVYDDCNNITEIYKNNVLIRKYTYDDLQQMTREIIIEPGATTGKQYDFEYDLYGNILSKTESTYTVATGAITGSATAQFSYTDSTWKDLLTSCGNMSFTYDEIGNLRTYQTDNTSSKIFFNWGKGRQLESLAFGETAESAEIYVEYGYNADGIRISRSFNGRGLEYIVDGDKILKQVGCGVGVLQTLEFYYDALGEIIGFNYANQDYYFGKNLQGDVVELYQGGTLIATYEYDAWGRVLSIKDASGVTIADDINSTHVAVINPIRYRGYYYDIEKSMYYLNSRYYYPTIGRFVSADGYVSTGQDILGTNMFAYCGNNPVSFSDPYGMWTQVSGGWQAQSGDTLWKLAVQLYGDGTKWTTFEFERDPKTLQVGEIINTVSSIRDSTSKNIGLTVKIRDVTGEVNRALSPYITLGRNIALLANNMPLYEPYRYGMFALLVNHGAVWDIKRQISWDSTIGTPFPGNGAMISYRGMIMTPENLGNYLYGLLGAAFGITYQTLINGSVFAAYSGGSMKNFSFGITNEFGDWNYIALGYLGYFI